MKIKEAIDTIFIISLQNFDNYDSLNSIEIKIEGNKILANLHKYKNKNYKYRFLVNCFLFSSGIKNFANILFITFNGLNDIHDSIINKKVYNLLEVAHVEQIKNWEKLKRISNWGNATLTNSDEPLNSDHFVFGFETKNPNNLLSFTFSLLNEKGGLIEFPGTEKKTLLLSLQIQILKR